MHWSSCQRGQGLCQRGLTLIELMVTVSILSVLLALAVPSFQTLIASSKLTTATNDLVATLSQARSEAIRLGGRVSVCKSSDGIQCAITGDWSQGWIVFADANRTTPNAVNAFVNAGEVITFSAPPLSTGMVITGNASVAQYLSFSADGQSKTLNGGLLMGTIRVCNTSTALTNDKRARDLTINSIGRIKTEQPTGVGAACPSPP